MQAGRIAAQDDHDYRYNPAAFAYGSVQRQAQMLAASTEGRPIYLVADHDFQALLQRIVPPGDGVWTILHAEGDAGLARVQAVR